MTRRLEILVPIWCESESFDTFEKIAAGPANGRFAIDSGSLGFDGQAGFLVMVFDTQVEAEAVKNAIEEFRDLQPVWGSTPTGEGVVLVHSDDGEIVMEDRRRDQAVPLKGSWELSREEVEQRLLRENLVFDPGRPDLLEALTTKELAGSTYVSPADDAGPSM